jgi:glyoxylate utilization-related uncharacterized protein
MTTLIDQIRRDREASGGNEMPTPAMIEARARRANRVPQMEEAILAAVDVVDELEHIMHMHTLTYDSATDAIIAFRKSLEVKS